MRKKYRKNEDDNIYRRKDNIKKRKRRKCQKCRIEKARYRNREGENSNEDEVKDNKNTKSIEMREK